MSYQYDVFISVNWDPIFAQWIREHFLPLFEAYLRQDVIAECDRELKGIFYYKDDIEPGQRWKNELKKAIPRARCAVALCSPGYFKSEYCLLEWRSFSDRSAQEKADLIVPVSIHDGQAFPAFATDIQAGNLNDFVIVGDGFKKTATYAKFQESLRNLSTSVAKLIRDAPDFKEWPIANEAVLAAVTEPVIGQKSL